jgi:hypothetical protein
MAKRVVSAYHLCKLAEWQLDRAIRPDPFEAGRPYNGGYAAQIYRAETL